LRSATKHGTPKSDSTMPSTSPIGPPPAIMTSV
jgi:hypothetical protein